MKDCDHNDPGQSGVKTWADRGQFQLSSIDWTRLHRYKWIPLVIAGVWVLFVWIQIFIAPRNDFRVHWESGRRLANGLFLYEGGHNLVNTPFWALVHAPLSFLGMHLAQVVVYPFAVISIMFLVWVLNELSAPLIPLSSDSLFWSTVLAILLASFALGRDLPEVGINTALVALSWLAFYFWSKHRDISGGIVLGLAVALRCTPFLFVAWFVLKRQWKMVAVSLIACSVFTLSPVLITGLDEYIHTMDSWIKGAVGGLSDPGQARGSQGKDKVENLALRPALSRYLTHLPYGHKGRPEASDLSDRPDDPPNPYYYQFLNLPPFWAGLVSRSVIFALLIAMFWLMRHKPHDRGSPELVWECTSVSILILLVSPITWVQHCVGVFPAVYLICRSLIAGLPISRLTAGAAGVFVLFCDVLNRGLFGRQFIKLANSYRVKTVGILLLLYIVVVCRRKILKEGLEEQLDLPSTGTH